MCSLPERCTGEALVKQPVSQRFYGLQSGAVKHVFCQLFAANVKQAFLKASDSAVWTETREFNCTAETSLLGATPKPNRFEKATWVFCLTATWGCEALSRYVCSLREKIAQEAEQRPYSCRIHQLQQHNKVNQNLRSLEAASVKRQTIHKYIEAARVKRFTTL